MYRERESATGGVVWTGAGEADGLHRVMPDGCMDLVWDGGGLLAAGPDTAAYFADWGPGAVYVGLRLPPGTGPAALGVPAHELRDRRVPLEDLWSTDEARRLGEKVALAADPGAPLERAAARRIAASGGTDPVMREVAALLGAGASVARAAETTGLSPRHLHRRSLAAFGYGPRTLGRILRFERALAAARTGTPFAEVAAAAGYADQAHLAREARELAGDPLSVLTGRAGRAGGAGRPVSR
ncbi:helix-turn-helix domain-containing protein [Streptomonospora wellingtoniae]|uniref:Helix-turn-helix domain-containing protein n=1 Tax=Streptomonospora wellingtoniae TaxID=3075544 RepID=A0ABU2KXW2_9ACTN|nr:helix-turn-helix domain-containing protein [Streptomonospora sp. DSM 45055]MDT0304012.1 helix-turn-helix domain-containing protein [Streptomonospora sp. DSM 45055]